MPNTNTQNTRYVYLNIFEGKYGLFTLGENDTRAEADYEADVLAEASGGNRVGCMRIELVKGQWDTDDPNDTNNND